MTVIETNVFNAMSCGDPKTVAAAARTLLYIWRAREATQAAGGGENRRHCGVSATSARRPIGAPALAINHRACPHALARQSAARVGDST